MLAAAYQKLADCCVLVKDGDRAIKYFGQAAACFSTAEQYGAAVDCQLTCLRHQEFFSLIDDDPGILESAKLLAEYCTKKGDDGDGTRVMWCGKSECEIRTVPTYGVVLCSQQ